MIAEKKTLKKITMATGVVAMAVGLAATFSLDANALSTTGGTGYKGPGQVVDCAGWGTGDKVVCLSTNSIDCTPQACQ